MRSYKRLLRFLVALLILAAPFLIWWQWNAIYDWYRLRGYTPPVAITALASQDTMTAQARHIFYVNRPVVENDVGAFRSDCSANEQTIILGCYHAHETGIYVYNVQDAELNGIQQVTAAHEMLHAAYDRLSAKERSYIDGLLSDYYQNDVHDQRLIDTINAYKKTEPNDVVNEMHSIFGTEVASLPQPLEDYYKQYFSDRSAVAAYAAGYESQFTSRSDQITADDAQLASLKQQIDAEEQDLNSQSAQIQSDRARLDSERSSGQIAAYNSGVGPFNTQVNAYNQGVAQLKNNIANYNDLVVNRNAIAQALASLAKAIDTRLTTQSAQ